MVEKNASESAPKRKPKIKLILTHSKLRARFGPEEEDETAMEEEFENLSLGDKKAGEEHETLPDDAHMQDDLEERPALKKVKKMN